MPFDSDKKGNHSLPSMHNEKNESDGAVRPERTGYRSRTNRDDSSKTVARPGSKVGEGRVSVEKNEAKKTIRDKKAPMPRERKTLPVSGFVKAGRGVVPTAEPGQEPGQVPAVNAYPPLPGPGEPPPEQPAGSAYRTGQIVGIKGAYTGTFTAMPTPKPFADKNDLPVAGTGLLYAKNLRDQGLLDEIPESSFVPGQGQVLEEDTAELAAELPEKAAGAAAPPISPPPPEDGEPENVERFNEGNGFTKFKNWLLSLHLYEAAGQMFYNIGFVAEFRFVQFWRFFKEAMLFLSQVVAWIFGGVASRIGLSLRNLGKDIAAPFVRIVKGFSNMRSVIAEGKERGESGVSTAFAYLKSGVKSYGHLLLNLAGLILPALSTVILILVINNVAGKTYALAVEYNGKTLGHITDQTVLQDAKVMLRSRLRLAKDQEIKDWQFYPDLRLTTTDAYTTTAQLVNEILRNGMDEEGGTAIVQATGLYVNGDLYTVTTEGDRLAEYLQQKLDAYYDPENPEAQVGFVQNVVCEPNPDDVYLEASVESYDKILERLEEPMSPSVVVNADGEKTLEEIAAENDLTMEMLVARNPEFENESPDYVPPADEPVLVERARTVLQVRTSFRVSSTEEIPFETTRQETDKLAKKVERVTQKGENGLQEVFDDYMYIDGELVSVTRVDELTVVMQPPVDEIIEVGTYDFSRITSVGYNSAYLWPVPGATGSSRGMSAYHRGRDINAPYGTPILAANAGTVIVAGTHWSYGNYVEIQHADGVVTLYAHCSSLAVSVGDVVSQGQYIAAVGSTGVSTGNHLHLEFQVNGGLVNPDNYISPPWK